MKTLALVLAFISNLPIKLIVELSLHFLAILVVYLNQ